MLRPFLFALLLPLAACADEGARPSPTPRTDAGSGADAPAPRPLGEAESARVTLEPVSGSGVRGTARLDRYDTGVRVELTAEGLAPGLHGVHVHDAPSCDALDGSPHFDPAGAPHGDPEDPRPLHHAGDLGNLRATEANTRLDRVFTDLALDGPGSVVGRVLVIDAGQDDLNTQPSGGSGVPVACGVITAEDLP